MASKITTISMTDEVRELAKDQSVKHTGRKNLSGYFSYLILEQKKRDELTPRNQ